MLVIIKSAPDTGEAKAGLSIARETGSDLVLLQDGVYLARQGKLEGVRGAVYVLEDDVKLRGAGAQGEGAKSIGYGELVDLMANDKTVGMF